MGGQTGSQTGREIDTNMQGARGIINEWSENKQSNLVNGILFSGILILLGHFLLPSEP
jgi:hypothetical protein